MDGGAIDPEIKAAVRITHRFFWTSQATVFRPARPPEQPREICGVVEARASLRRVHRGRRGQVKLWVKPSAVDAAIQDATSEG